MRSSFLGEVLLRRRGGPELNLRDVLRRRGAILSVSTGHPTSVAAGLRAAGKPVSAPRTLQAMIDTGASVSAIDGSAARAIGLVKTGETFIAGVGGTSRMPVYATRISFPGGPKYDPIQLAGVSLGSGEFSILVGRDILSDMDLSYLGKLGKFTLTA